MSGFYENQRRDSKLNDSLNRLFNTQFIDSVAAIEPSELHETSVASSRYFMHKINSSFLQKDKKPKDKAYDRLKNELEH